MTYLRFILPLISLLSAWGCYHVGSTLHNEQLTAHQKNTQQLYQESFDGTQALAAKIGNLYSIAEELSLIAETNRNPLEIEKKLTAILTENKSLIGCSIAFAPFMFNNETRLFSRRVVRTADTITPYALETREDYTIAEWFRKAQAGNGTWSTPFFDDVSKQTVLHYSYPFLIKDPITAIQNFGGVVTVTISLIELNNFVMGMSLEKDTYSVLIHRDGVVLTFQSEEIIYQEKTITTLAREPGKNDLLKLYDEFKHKNEGELTIMDEQQHKLFKTVFKKIPDTPWFLVLMHLENTNLISTHAVFQSFTLLLLLCALCLASLASFIFFMLFTATRAAWLSASCCAILLAACIATIWALDIISMVPTSEHNNAVDTELALERFFFLQRKSNAQIYRKEPHLIPTGIFITSFDVGHESSITVGGQVWQKYDRAKYPNDEPGIVFFDATDQTIEKIYTTTKNSVETVGWRFHVTIPANFNYLKYPFDEQNIIISMGHINYLTNTILIPDFSAFRPDDSAKSEVDPNTKSAQWTIQESYPFYQLTDFNTNFGVQGYTQQKGFPHLSFAISIRRLFVYPLTASALPVTIILFVVFSIVLFTGLTTKRETLATEIIKLTSSIFFGAAIAHQTFQRSLQSAVITYFEYFYFLIYAIILITAINGMLYAYERGGSFINFHHNLLPRLLYWPITLFLCLLLTLSFFY